VTILRASRAARAMPWIAGGIVLAVGLAIVNALPVGVAFDDGMYVVLAKSLATGQGYRWLHVPGAPPATHFPPGYPALLALLWTIVPSFPANVVLFKIANACLLAAGAVGMTIFLRNRCGLGPVASGVVAVAGSIGIPTLVLSSMVMSEPFFFALLIPTLLLAERVTDGETTQADPSPLAQDDRKRWGYVVAAGVAAGALTLVRSHAIALVAALPLVLLLRRRVRDAAMAVGGSVVAMLPWQLWVRAHEGGVPAPIKGMYGSYSAWLARGFEADGISLVWRTLRRTVPEVGGMFAAATAPGIPGGWGLLVFLFFASLLVAGVIRLWRSASVTTAFILLYLSIVVLWPFPPARFVWAIWPLVFVLPVFGAMTFWEWRPSIPAIRVTRGVALTGAAVVAIGYARYTANGYRGRWWSSIARENAQAARGLVGWTRARTQPTDVVMTNAEPLLYLYANRATVPAESFAVADYFRAKTRDDNQDALRRLLATYRVDVVALAGSNGLIAAARSMADGPAPELVVRDSFPGGGAFTPRSPAR
jgi:hypothetical protein